MSRNTGAADEQHARVADRRSIYCDGQLIMRELVAAALMVKKV